MITPDEVIGIPRDQLWDTTRSSMPGNHNDPARQYLYGYWHGWHGMPPMSRSIWYQGWCDGKADHEALDSLAS